MITCVLKERLGNQMFQIAATIATAVNYGVPYSIPKETLNNWFPAYFKHLPESDLGLKRKIKTYTEREYKYQPIPYSSGTLRLDGYFQSYKYFELCPHEIMQAFEPITSCTQDLSRFVSIHVRRGDYLTNPEFAVLELGYYRAAIEYFQAMGFSKFYVFSDDMKWCVTKFNDSNFPKCEFIYSLVGTEMHDMRLMTRCAHHIIANSSFSWWGAWLNCSPRKIVIAPDTWFKNKNADMLPPEWLIFKNE